MYLDMLSNQQQVRPSCSKSLASLFIKYTLFVCLIFISCVLSTYSLANSAPSNIDAIDLTTEEQAWLASHPTFKVAAFPLAPYIMKKEVKVTGYMTDLLRAVSTKVNLTPQFSYHKISNEAFTAVQTGKAEASMGMIETSERAKYLTFSPEVMPLNLSIFARKNSKSMSSLESLKNKRIASYHGYTLLALTKKQLPDAELVLANDAVAMLQLVATGKADAAIQELHTGQYMLRNNHINNLEVKGYVTFKGLGVAQGHSYTVNKAYPLLKSILDKGYQKLTEKEKQQLWDKWFARAEPISIQDVQLTADERTWLADNPVIRLGNSVDWPPFGFIKKDGVYSGIAADYFAEIEKMLGITFEPATLSSWKDTVNAARKGEVDLLDAVVPTPQRREFLAFTKPYISYPVVLFAHKHVDYIANMSALNGQRVAVISGSGLHDILINNHPEFEIVATKNARDGLLSVEKKEASAFIGNLPTASQVISREGITNLKVAGETPYRYDLAIGINKNKPILASLIQKALGNIPEEKHNEIYRKWMSVTFEHDVDYSFFIKLFVLSIIIFILILIWNRQCQIKKLTLEVKSRKKIEEALRQSDERLHLLVSQADFQLWSVDKDLKFTQSIGGGLDELGLKPGEVVGLDLYQFFQTDSSEFAPIKAHLDALAGSNNVYETEWQGRYFQSRLSPQYDSEGNVTGCIGVAIDITDRNKAENEKKHLQRELQQSQKMDALGKLTGGIAHEYNNMLAIMIGFSELLKKSLNEQPKLFKYADSILHAGKRAAKLTNKLLTFSRFKTSEAEFINLNTLLLKQQHMLEKTLTVRINLVLKMQENLWPVWLDEGDMEDVIINMSINAMHAIADNGQLTITTHNQQINQMDAQSLDIPAGDYVLLSFVDTGCGIDEKIKEKIFDPFFTTKGMDGTGLGLSMVYGFVQNSGGIIKVYSELDHGAEFRLYFPRYHGASGVKKSEKENNSEENFIANKTILVVDDEVALLELTSEILSEHGFKVICAESAKEALNILQEESIEILISDIIMPDMDGYQLAVIVKDKYPEVKIQLVSGFSDERSTRGVDEHLQQNMLYKPFNLQTFLQRIHELSYEN